jgi:hypothetical protein
MSQPLAQGRDTVRVSDCHQLWGEFKDLLGKQIHVLSGTECDNVESVRSILDDG